MTTYRMLQPGLAEVTHDSGQSIVLPIDEATAQAQGLQPAGLQLPHVQNPYSMIGSGQAVAGPGGAATDLGTGAGVFAQPGPNYGRGVPTVAQQVQLDSQALVDRLRTPVPTSHETAPPQSKFDYNLPPQPPGGAPEGLVRAGSRAGQQQEAGQGQPGIDPLVLEAMAQGGGGGPRRLGVTSETRKYHEAGPVDPELSASIKAGQEQLDQASSNSLEDRALHEGDFLEQQAALQQERAQQIQAAMQRRQAVDNEIGRLQSRSEQAQQALLNSQPKTVDQFWKDRGTAAQIGAAIAMSLGAWGATIGHTENMGMKLVDQTIDRWMNDQIQQYNVAKDKAVLANNAYKQAVDLYGSPELAQTNLQLQALAAKESLIKTQAEQIGTTDALGQAQLALQENQQKRRELQALAQQQAGADVEAKYTMQGGGGGGGGDILSRLKRGAEAKGLTDYLGGKTDKSGKAIAAAADSPLAVRFPDGSTRFAGNAKEKTAAQRVVRSAHEAIQKIDRLQQLTESASSRTWGDEDRARAESLLGGLVFEAHDAMGVATFQEATKQNIERMVGDPEHFFRSPGAAAKLNELKRQMQDQIEANKKSLGKGAPAAGSAPDDSELPESAQEIVE
jgi:hypothetical protein